VGPTGTGRLNPKNGQIKNPLYVENFTCDAKPEDHDIQDKKRKNYLIFILLQEFLKLVHGVKISDFKFCH